MNGLEITEEKVIDWLMEHNMLRSVPKDCGYSYDLESKVIINNKSDKDIFVFVVEAKE